ncbi:MAG: SDR family NAD(P)-dependent oxidoreductase [Sulfitobacter sp.]
MDFPRTPGFDLIGKRALVAGASSGIGLACAVALAEHGAAVTLAARSGGKLRDIAVEMNQRGWQAEVMELDVADVTSTKAAVAEHGPFDILVNSAGLARHAPALETTEADFDMVSDLNVKGAYFLTQAVAQGLKEAGRPGSLINISSQMAHVGGIDRAVYCATKHAVEGFTKAMAIEWGKLGIRVNTICPTFILTPLTQSTFDNPERAAWIMDKIKLGRPGTVEDIMGSVVFLASESAAMITGTSLMVDGGWTAD